MPKNTSRIGKDDERPVVKDLEKRGYKARRQPGSGNRAVDLQHDILWFDSPAGKLHIECKYREDCKWKVLEKWRAGADILTVRCDARKSGQEGQRMAFLSWDLLLALVGDAAVRDDLSALEGIDERSCSSALDGAVSFAEELTRRAKIQSAHQNPKPKPAKPNKLRGRGFGK